jgi:hypothetical protein
MSVAQRRGRPTGPTTRDRAPRKGRLRLAGITLVSNNGPHPCSPCLETVRAQCASSQSTGTDHMPAVRCSRLSARGTPPHGPRRRTTSLWYAIPDPQTHDQSATVRGHGPHACGPLFATVGTRDACLRSSVTDHSLVVRGSRLSAPGTRPHGPGTRTTALSSVIRSIQEWSCIRSFRYAGKLL